MNAKSEIFKCKNCQKTVYMSDGGWRHAGTNLYQCKAGEVRIHMSKDYVAQPEMDDWNRPLFERTYTEGIQNYEDINEKIPNDPFAVSIAREIKQLEEKALQEWETKKKNVATFKPKTQKQEIKKVTNIDATDRMEQYLKDSNYYARKESGEPVAREEDLIADALAVIYEYDRKAYKLIKEVRNVKLVLNELEIKLVNG